MPANEVVDMIREALRAMAIGIPGVFAVLAVIYGAVKLMTLPGRRDTRGG